MFATLRIALMAIRRNVLRSFLTMLGIIIGVGAVVLLTSFVLLIIAQAVLQRGERTSRN